MTGRAPVRRRSSITTKDRAAFLEALEHGWSVKNAAERTTHRRQLFYELRTKDEEFAAAWDEAWTAGTATLEDEARRRAVDGYDEETFDGKGELLRRVHRYSDALMHRLLAARDPERFGNTRVEVTGVQGEPIVVDHRAGLTLEHLAEFAASLKASRHGAFSPALEYVAGPALSPGSPAPARTHQGGEVHAKGRTTPTRWDLSGEERKRDV
jgi:hypothetical protein